MYIQRKPSINGLTDFKYSILAKQYETPKNKHFITFFQYLNAVAAFD